MNPWDVGVPQAQESAGWANFDNFDSTLNIASPPPPQNPKEAVPEASKQESVPETTITDCPPNLDTSMEKKAIVEESGIKKEEETSIKAESLPPTMIEPDSVQSGR